MKVQVSFKVVNSDYEPVDENWYDKFEIEQMKYHVAHKYESENVQAIRELPNAVVNVYGVTDQDEEIQFELKNMHVFECEYEEGKSELYLVSSDVLRNTHKDHQKKYDTTRFYFYIHDTIGFTNLNDITYVSAKSFPEELLGHTWKEFKTNTRNEFKTHTIMDKLPVNR